MKKRYQFIFSVFLFILIIYFLPFAGFFYNDWHPILGQITNTSLIDLFKVDRPTLGLIYTVTVNIFGNSAYLWQLFSGLLRIFSGISLYILLIQLWPKQKYPVSLMAIFFVLYPGFMQQPVALTFSNHLIGLNLGLLSLSVHLFALKKGIKPWIKWVAYIISFGMAGMYLMIYEYMIGLELVRWILIWYVSFPKEWKKIGKNIPLWLRRTWVFFIPVMGLLYFRFFYFQSARPTMDVDVLISSYQTNPFFSVVQMILNYFSAILNTTLFAWFVPLYQRMSSLNIGNFFNERNWGLVWFFLCFLWVIYEVLKDYKKNDRIQEKETRDWSLESIVLGALFILVTLAPIVLSNREVRFSNLLDRYTLQSAFGVVMLVVGVGHKVIFSSRIRIIFFSGIFFLSSLFLLANQVYWSIHWEYQRQLFWQIYWRAPVIKPDTVVMALQPEGYLFREDEDVFAPLNYIYYPEEGFIHLVAEVLSDETVDDLINQNTTYRTYRTVNFKRVFSQALVVSNTNPDTCVHIIDGEHPELIQNETALIKLAAPYSRIDQIMADRWWVHNMPDLFESEPEHSWCYYYQKADLARQLEDWKMIKYFGDRAKEEKFTPNDVSEWYPFMEGYAGVGDWESAQVVIDQIHEDENRTDSYCRTHQGYADYDDFRAELYQKICSLED